jgi:hypothetical protein
MITTFKNNIKNKIAYIRLKLNPESIFLRAVEIRIKNSDPGYGKQYYIECYKLVANFNSYIFDLMCRDDIIDTRDSMISKFLG